MRSLPLECRGEVSSASAPKLRAAASTSSLSVAITTDAAEAAMARRQTCSISGAWPIRASGLPGRRSEAMRAGMTMW